MTNQSNLPLRNISDIPPGAFVAYQSDSTAPREDNFAGGYLTPGKGGLMVAGHDFSRRLWLTRLRFSPTNPQLKMFLIVEDCGLKEIMRKNKGRAISSPAFPLLK